MSITPAFELGLWNAWILMIPALLFDLLFIHLRHERGAPREKVHQSKVKTGFDILSNSIYFLIVIYSIFLPLELGTTWFYLGLPIALIGLVGNLITVVNWANTPDGKLVTRGLYRFSRHPMYVTKVLLLLGVSIASASWVFLVFSITTVVEVVYFVKTEEAQLIEHYGVEYLEYKNRTPRWIGKPKSREGD